MNSPLVDVVIKSPNYSSRNGNTIKGITIHHTAGKLTATQIGNIFAKASRKASCNYGVGNDGKIVLCVDEQYRSWCSSSRANDENMITLEVSNCKGAPNWEVSDAALESTIRLVTDICRRNGIKELKFLNDSTKKFDYAAQNMTLHCWFASTSCPGPYLKGKMSYIAKRVNDNLGVSAEPSAPVTPAAPTSDVPFRVRVKIPNLNIRKSPNGKVTGKYTGKGIFTIVQVSGDWGKLKSGAGWIYLANKSYCERI